MKLFCYKGVAVTPSPRPLTGEQQGLWTGDYVLELKTDAGLTVQLCTAPGAFSSHGDAVAAIIPHACQAVDGVREGFPARANWRRMARKEGG